MSASAVRALAEFGAGLFPRRVPVILQQDPTECGAACLAMILAYHGRRTNLAESRARCGSGRDGSSAHALAQAARSFGLSARGFSVPTAGDLAALRHPMIAHWQFNHFVVVERSRAERVEIVDPAHGRRLLTRAEFDAGFTGVVLTFEAGAALERAHARATFTWRSYLGGLFGLPGVRSALTQICVASLLLQVLGLALPIFTKIVVDALIPRGLSSFVPTLALGMGVWVVTYGILSYLRGALLLSLRTRLDARVMLSFFEHLLSLPFSYFQSRTSGDLLLRLSSNSVLREIFTNQTISVLLDGVLVLAYLALLLALAPTFGVIAFAIGALQAAILLLTTRHTARLTQRDLAAQTDSQSYLVEALNGIATLKASGAEGRALAQWTERFHRQLSTSFARSHFSTVVETLLGGVRTASPLVLLLFGADAVLQGRLSLGAMLALIALAASFLAPLSSLLATTQNLQVVGAHLDRIADVLEAPSEQQESGATPVTALQGRFELRNVSFRYAPNAADVVSDVSLAIEPGEKVALVGPTGSGKSTLGMLLLGLYSPTAGEILCDGRPLFEWKLTELRRHFGVVLQNTSLFSGSLRENIAFHDPTLSADDVRRAARLACIDEEIAALPLAYETVLAEGGSGFSGGQRQRLALARALVLKPRVLLLDEATSHLDPVTESRVDESLGALACTRIVIAHRLSTVRSADRIFVLNAGRIVERGTHAELVALRGTYAALVSRGG